MKKLLIILVATGLTLSASAQRYGHGGGYVRAPRVVVRTGIYAPYYPYYGYPFSPYPYYGYAERPTRLELKIEDIHNDYRDRIWSAKQDLKGKEKRKTVRQLKHDRDQAIIDAKRNYYKTGR